LDAVGPPALVAADAATPRIAPPLRPRRGV